MSRRPFLTPGANPRRAAIERRSAVVLVFLRRLPRPLPGLAVLGLVALGLALPGLAGAASLLAVAALLGWLLYLSWPALPLPGRAVRSAVLVVVLAGTAFRLFE